MKNEIFDILENQKAGKNGEIQFTDSLNELTLKGDLLGYKFDGKTYDVGNKVGVLIASIEYGLKDEANRDSIKEYLKDLVSSEFKNGRIIMTRKIFLVILDYYCYKSLLLI